MVNHFDLHFSAPTVKHDRSSPARSSEPMGLLSAKDHRHYQSHNHVDTPYPVLEQSSTRTSTSSSSSSGSFLDINKHSGTALLSNIPNPVSMAVHIVEDHVVELRYGHTSREAKREARRLSQQSSKPWQVDAAMLRTMSIPEVEEVSETDREHIQKAWEAEVARREAASKTCAEESAVKPV